MSLSGSDLEGRLKGVEALRFGVFEADLARGELRRSGLKVKLVAQPFKLLVLLLSRPGEIIERDEIRAELWGEDTHVDSEQGINVAIAQVRHALGDRAGSPRFVETVPRRGYRFVAPVERVTAGAAAEEPGRSAPVDAAAAAPAHRTRRRRGRWVTVAAVVVVLVLAGLWRTRSPGPEKGEPPPRLLVLPFEALTPGSDYLATGLTEELITELSRQHGHRLGVIARTTAMSYAGSGKPVTEIARELDVGYVLEGSVRRHGEDVRVTAQLVRADDQEHLWAATYDRRVEDLLSLETEVSERIAAALELHLLSAPVAPRERTASRSAATDLYLRGLEALRAPERPDPDRLTELFAEATRLDPGFAPAWVQLAAIRSIRIPQRQHMPLAREALAKALALDEADPAAHRQLAWIRFYYDWDFDGAREAWERALALDPTAAETHHAYAAWFSIHGRHAEAVAHAEEAAELDPRSPAVLSDVGWYSYFAGDMAAAVEHARHTIEVEERYLWAERLLLLAAPAAGRPEEAARVARRFLERDGVAGVPAEPEAVLELHWRHVVDRARRSEVPRDLDHLAIAHVELGQEDQALAVLEEAYRRHEAWILPFLGIHPAFEPLADDPRFADLLARIGIPSPDETREPRD